MRGFWGITPLWDETYRWAPKRHILDENRVDWCKICRSGAHRVGCAFAQQVTGKKLRGPYISPTWGAATPQPIIKNFGLTVGLTDDINCSNFCIDRLRGLRSVRCWKWQFPLLSDHCPKHSVERYRAYTWWWIYVCFGILNFQAGFKNNLKSSLIVMEHCKHVNFMMTNMQSPTTCIWSIPDC
jgi:hypothetical protein